MTWRIVDRHWGVPMVAIPFPSREEAEEEIKRIEERAGVRDVFRAIEYPESPGGLNSQIH